MDSYLGSPEPLGEFPGKKDVGKLRISVGGPAIVPPWGNSKPTDPWYLADVVGKAAGLEDSSLRCRQHQRQEAAGEKKSREVVHRPLVFEAVHRLLRVGDHDSGIVPEDIELGTFLLNLDSEFGDLPQIREVGGHEVEVSSWNGPAQVLENGETPGFGPGLDQYPPTLATEDFGSGQADARGTAGDQDGFLAHVPKIVLSGRGVKLDRAPASRLNCRSMNSAPVFGFWSSLPRPFTVLAPMEEVTDTVFRRLIADRGAPHVFMSEFINAGEYFHKKRKYGRQHAFIDPAETYRPLVAQIWGNDPEAYRRLIPLLLASGFNGIDINMGCPAEKVVRRGECSGLIDRPAQARELILAAQEAAGEAPVSVKTRLGVKAVKTEEWAGFLLEQNLPVLTIHGRISVQMSDGEADWNAVRRVRELRDQMAKATLVVGNGDLFSADDLDRRHRETGVDGLMVGRGIFRDPDIFRADRPHRSFETVGWAERRDVMVQHIEEHRRVWGGQKGYHMLKAFFKIYTRGPEEYLVLRTRLFETVNYEQALEVLAAWDREAGATGL